MAAYLLGSQALIDIARNERSAIHRWAEQVSVAADDVVVSVASFTLFKSTVDALPVTERPTWQRLFHNALARFKTVDGIVPVDLSIALRAAELRTLGLETEHEGAREPLGDLTCLVAATALECHLTLIDSRKPYHERLEFLHGLALIDPRDA